MPAKSKEQQRLFGMVYAYKQGELDLDELSDSLAKKVKNIADGVSMDTAREYAETDRKGLPKKLSEYEATLSNVGGMGPVQAPSGDFYTGQTGSGDILTPLGYNDKMYDDEDEEDNYEDYEHVLGEGYVPETLNEYLVKVKNPKDKLPEKIYNVIKPFEDHIIYIKSLKKVRQLSVYMIGFESRTDEEPFLIDKISKYMKKVEHTNEDVHVTPAGFAEFKISTRYQPQKVTFSEEVDEASAFCNPHDEWCRFFQKKYAPQSFRTLLRDKEKFDKVKYWDYDVDLDDFDYPEDK
jgi:hypothetical protein